MRHDPATSWSLRGGWVPVVAVAPLFIVVGAILVGGALSVVMPAFLDPIGWVAGAAAACAAYRLLLQRRGLRPLRAIALVFGPVGVVSGTFWFALAAWACDSGGCSTDESRQVVLAVVLVASALAALSLGWWRPRRRSQ